MMTSIRYQSWIMTITLIGFFIVPMTGLIRGMAGPLYAGEETREEPITITSNKMDADRKSKLVIFRGNVVAQQKDFTLYSDELYVYYNEGEDVREIIAVGNVKMTQPDRLATGERAVYERVGRKVTLTGNPQVRQGPDTVKGTKIIVFLDEDKSLVEGAGEERVKAVIFPKKGSTTGTKGK